MKKPILAILALILASISCGTYVTPTPEAILLTTVTPLSPTMTATVPTSTPRTVETDQQSAVIVQALVNVRAEPNGEVIGSLNAGDSVNVLSCVDNWCQIEKPSGYIWQGCLSDNPDKLGCTAK